MPETREAHLPCGRFVNERTSPDTIEAFAPGNVSGVFVNETTETAAPGGPTYKQFLNRPQSAVYRM